MTDTLVTYHSLNSRPEHQWLGYINFNGKRLNVTFFGETEDDVKAKMKEFYAKDKTVRDANRARRARQKEAAVARADRKNGAA